MKKIVTITAGLMLCASLAMAAGVSLNVGDCSLGPANHAVTNACTSNTGTAFTAFGSFIMGNRVKTAFVGTMNIVDIQTSQPTIPDWWRADACRSAGFVVATDALMGGSCGTLWDAVPAAGNNLTALPGVGGPARVRYLIGAVLLSTNAYDLIGNDIDELSVFKLSVGRTKTTGTGLCAGCSFGACIVLNDVQLQGLYDTGSVDFIDVTGPLPGALDYISYNSGAGLCSGQTPTNNRTWGSVKALYR